MATGDLIKSAQYVKFIRGSETAYNYLKQNNRISEDTLYFIYDKNAPYDTQVGKLYMGSILISDDSLREALTLNIVAEELDDGQILVYNNGAWENQDVSQVISGGSATQVLQVTLQNNQTDVQAIAASNPTGLHTGDLAIITDGNQKRTYVYVDNAWTPLNVSEIINSLQPTSAIPLDARSLFDNLEDAEDAAADAVAPGGEGTYYFGEVITVIEDDVATLYLIQPDGELKEVGVQPIPDNATIELDANDQLKIYNFNEEYYAWDTEHERYQLTSGFTSGLEPKVVLNGLGQYEIGWYEPNPTTAEGLSAAVGTLQQRVGTIETTVNNLSNNMIQTVDGQYFIISNGELTLNQLETSDINGLDASLSNLNTQVANLNTDVGNLSDLYTDLASTVSDLDDRLTWQEIQD